MHSRARGCVNVNAVNVDATPGTGDHRTEYAEGVIQKRVLSWFRRCGDSFVGIPRVVPFLYTHPGSRRDWVRSESGRAPNGESLYNAFGVKNIWRPVPQGSLNVREAHVEATLGFGIQHLRCFTSNPGSGIERLRSISRFHNYGQPASMSPSETRRPEQAAP